MDKSVGKLVQGVMGKGEKMAPVKSLKVKVKFQKPKKSKKSYKQDKFGAHQVKTKKKDGMVSFERGSKAPRQAMPKHKKRKAMNVPKAIKSPGKFRNNAKPTLLPASKNNAHDLMNIQHRGNNGGKSYSESDMGSMQSYGKSLGVHSVKKRKTLLQKMKKFKRGSGNAMKLFKKSFKKPSQFGGMLMKR